MQLDECIDILQKSDVKKSTDLSLTWAKRSRDLFKKEGGLDTWNCSRIKLYGFARIFM